VSKPFQPLSDHCAPVPAASAPGKLILCGEHAVVYGRPAIAIPLKDIRAYAEARRTGRGSGVRITAPDLVRSWLIDDEPEDPLSQVAVATLNTLDRPAPDVDITIRSDIPIASGMGSGAAIATAVVRLLAQIARGALPDAKVSQLVYESEKRFHGTPSGIDNTVVAFERPIWFQRRDSAPEIKPVAIAAPLTLVIADTGVRSATWMPVGAVREYRLLETTRYEALFDSVKRCVEGMRTALAAGQVQLAGKLASANHVLLQQIGVSSPELDRLVQAAHAAGALGAKLSGAGWGGVMLAIVEDETRHHVADALRQAGAARVFISDVPVAAMADF
jgi:mevalonate kinase